MTVSQIIACALAWTAAIAAVLGAVLSQRAQERARAVLLAVRAERRTLSVGDGVITFPRRMSDAEVEAFKARWQATYGKPGTAHQVKPLEEGAVCSDYQPPAAAEMTGLCARCGMYDYKHEEQT